jgi:hypothetical protein
MLRKAAVLNKLDTVCNSLSAFAENGCDIEANYFKENQYTLGKTMRSAIKREVLGDYLTRRDDCRNWQSMIKVP